MFDSTLTTQEQEIVNDCMEVVLRNPNLDLCRIIAKLNIQIASLRTQLHEVHEPEDYKEYTVYDKDRFKKPLAKKVLTKYGR